MASLLIASMVADVYCDALTKLLGLEMISYGFFLLQTSFCLPLPFDLC